MKKLARKWQKSHDDKSSLPIRDDGDSCPLDTEEQEEFVRSLEKTQAQQSLLWRTVFAGFLFCYVAFLLFSIYQQATSPWELRFHAYFMEDLDSWMVIYAGFILASFWLYFMLRMSRFRWDVLWLPFGPLCGASICLYVDHLLSNSSEEVRKLRGYMYAYKAS